MCIFLAEFCSMEEGFYAFVLRICILSEIHLIHSVITLVASSMFDIRITPKFPSFEIFQVKFIPEYPQHGLAGVMTRPMPCCKAWRQQALRFASRL